MSHELTGPPDVHLDNVTTILGSAAVLHRLELFIPAGKVTVLMGPSGVGKTTLIKHIVGLQEPDGGAVYIAGRDIWAQNPDQWRELRRGMGAMLGGHTLYSTSLFSSMTVAGNLVYSLKALDVPEAERLPRAHARLAELDLLDVADELPESLPAHAAKRLALARALVLDAPLTVLDEIDVGLDHDHSRAMVQAVHSLRERTGCTLLVTTHTLSLARSLADNLAIMVNGRIVATGPPEEVLDGIVTTDDFDRRFEFSDPGGPPRLDRAMLDADRGPAARPVAQVPRDNSRQLWLVVAAITLIVAVFFAVRAAEGAFTLF